MSSINGFADIVQDWEGLLAAAKEHAELLGAVEPERLSLERDLADARILKARQEAQNAGRQELTQQIRELVGHGKAQAIAIRAVAKGKIGYRNERLVQFGMIPRRKRARKPVAAAKTPASAPAEASTPDTDPES